MVWPGEAWCGADQAKKQAPHLKTGSPLSSIITRSLDSGSVKSLSSDPQGPLALSSTMSKIN